MTSPSAPPPAPRTAVRPALRAASRVVGALVALACILVIVPASSPAGAQAEPVTVSTRTKPDFPKAGDDVTVSVRANGCPPGNALVEAYLVSSDDTSRSTALVAKQEFPSTLFFQVSADLVLPKALEGWYGIRIVCGQYRPAREPITNTYFRVAPNGTKTMTVFSNKVPVNGSLPVSGTGCPGTSVEVGMSQSPIKAVNFSPKATFAVNPGGTWSGTVPFTGLVPGRTNLRARCTLTTPSGDLVWINYDDDVFVDVLP